MYKENKILQENKFLLTKSVVGWFNPVMTTARDVNNGMPSLMILGKRIKILPRIVRRWFVT